MGQFLTNAKGQKAYFEDADIGAAQAAGWQLPDQVLSQSSETGTRVELPAAEYQQYTQQNPNVLVGPDFQAEYERRLEDIKKQRYSDAGNKLAAIVEGGARLGTFGLSDVALRALDTDVAEREKYLPEYGVAGEIGAALLTLGLGAVPGAVGSAAKAAIPALRTSRWVSEGATGLARTGRAAAEGMAYNVGSTIGDIALKSPELSAEAYLEHGDDIVASAALGGLAGGAIGGAIEAVAAKRAARTAAEQAAKAKSVANFESQAGKDMLHDMTEAHKGMELAADMAEKEARDAGDQALAQFQAEYVTEARTAADDIHLKAATRQYDVASIDNRLATETGPALERFVAENTAAFPEAYANSVKATADTVRANLAAGKATTRKEFEALLQKHNATARAVGVEPFERSIIDEIISLRPIDPERALGEINRILSSTDNVLSMRVPKDARTSDLIAQAVTGDAKAVRRLRSHLEKNYEVQLPDELIAEHAQLAAQRTAALDLGDTHARSMAKLDKAYAKLTLDGNLKNLKNYLVAARSEMKHLPEITDAAEAAIQQLSGMTTQSEKFAGWFGAQKIDRSAGLRALGIGTEEGITTNTFRRLLQQDGNVVAKTAGELNAYYDQLGQQIGKAGNAGAEFQRSMERFKSAMERVIPPELVDRVDEQFVRMALNLTEPPVLDGPGGMLLKVAAASKVMQQVRTVKPGIRTMAGKLMRAVGVGIGSGYGYGSIRGLPGVNNLPAELSMAIGAAGGATGRSLAGGAMDKMMGTGTAQALRHTETLESALQRTAKEWAAPKKTKAVRVQPVIDAAVSKLYNVREANEKPKSRNEKLDSIMQDLIRYEADPQTAGMRMFGMLKSVGMTVSERFQDAVETSLHTKFSFLASKLPRDPGTLTMFGRSVWKPTSQQYYELAASIAGAFLPTQAAAMIAAGTAPPQMAEAFMATNPGAAAKLAEYVADNMEDIMKNANFQQRLAISRLSGVPVDPMADPRYIRFIQQVHTETRASQEQQRASAPGAPSNKASELTEAQRLLA